MFNHLNAPPLRKRLECCGSVNQKDYKGAAVPNSCLSKVDATVYTSGCASKMLTYLRGKAGIVGGLALPILLIQALALLSAGCLIKSLESESRYFM
ncbi:uncharacterized protein TNCV_3835481 [Trichonephila clavipes]|nr:uncharacterized protein TNCV_3835481 [Trichonephila clavipes]